MVKMVSFLLTSESSLRSSLWIGASALVVVTVTPRLVRRYMDCLITSKKREGVFFFATSFVPTILLLHWQKVAWHTNLLVSACLTLFAWVVSSRPTKADKETVDPPMGPHLPPSPLEDLSSVTKEELQLLMVPGSSKEDQKVYQFRHRMIGVYQFWHLIIEMLEGMSEGIQNPAGKGVLFRMSHKALNGAEIYVGIEDEKVVCQVWENGRPGLDCYLITKEGVTTPDFRVHIYLLRLLEESPVLEENTADGAKEDVYQFWYLGVELFKRSSSSIQNPAGEGVLFGLSCKVLNGAEIYIGIEDEKVIYQVWRNDRPERGYLITKKGVVMADQRVGLYLLSIPME